MPPDALGKTIFASLVGALRGAVGRLARHIIGQTCSGAVIILVRTLITRMRQIRTLTNLETHLVSCTGSKVATWLLMPHTAIFSKIMSSV